MLKKRNDPNTEGDESGIEIVIWTSVLTKIVNDALGNNFQGHSYLSNKSETIATLKFICPTHKNVYVAFKIPIKSVKENKDLIWELQKPKMSCKCSKFKIN